MSSEKWDGFGLLVKYFVLNPTKNTPYGAASREALLTYAMKIELENPYLADDLRRWVQFEKTRIELIHGVPGAAGSFDAASAGTAPDA
jgi:hypothetical protein